MKKDLPNVFANAINKTFDNVQEVYYAKDEPEKEEVRKVSNVPIDVKLSRIFNSPSYVYKSRVLITTEDSKQEETIIGKANGILFTIDGKKIRIHEIIDIEEI